MMGAIDTFCPLWEPKRETLCTEKELVKQLAFMQPSHYKAIGPLCKRLKHQLKLMRTFKDPAMIDVTLAKEVTRMCDFGVETVAFVFFFSSHRT